MVNKMDLMDWSEETYEQIRADFEDYAAKLEIADVTFIPASALEGDNIVERSKNLDWYDGPTLLPVSYTHLPSDPRAVPRLPKLPDGMELPAGAIPMMETRSETLDEEGNARTDTAVVIPLSGYFPNTERLLRKNTPAIEVWTPAKLSGERGDDADYTIAAMMVRDASQNTWIPIALRVRLLSEAAEDRKPTRRPPQ